MVDVLQNDLYLNDGLKSVDVTQSIVEGSIEVTADYKLRFTPSAGYTGTVVFQYNVAILTMNAIWHL